jgi:acyl-CoA thioesterase-2
VDAHTFLGLQATAEPLRWRLPVTPGVASPANFLFGGCGLAAAVAAMEEASGRPAVWATAQYLSYAPVGSVLDIDVTLAAAGHQTTQARALGRVGDQEILTVNGAFGRRPGERRHTWAVRPSVPPPEDCPKRTVIDRMRGTVLDRVEIRTACGRDWDQLDGTLGDGRSAIWARLPGQLEPSSAWLSILGDYVPSGIAQALGRPAGGNSLDNTIRVLRLVPCEWILCDIRIQGIANGYGHGLGHLWAQDGTLLGTASQSVIQRLWADA